MLVVVWLALIVYTYLDARRRISDPFLVGCATVASFIPYIGTAVYAIVRPPEFLEDAHERELEIKAAELRVRQLTEQSCPNCELPGREELPALPELPAPAQGPLPELRQAGRPALGALPLLRDRAGRAQRRAAERRREQDEPRREERTAPRALAKRRAAPNGSRGARKRPAHQEAGEHAKQEPAARRRQRGAAPQTTAKEPQP